VLEVDVVEAVVEDELDIEVLEDFVEEEEDTEELDMCDEDMEEVDVVVDVGTAGLTAIVMAPKSVPDTEPKDTVAPDNAVERTSYCEYAS
jgi:hypothetical protein